MIKYILYFLKYIFSDVYFVVFSAFVISTSYVGAHLGFLRQPEAGFAYFFAVYLLSAYAEREISWPMPALLSARGRATAAVAVYLSVAPALLALAWASPPILLAPLLASLRREPALLAAGLVLTAPLFPLGAAAVAVFEALARARLIATIGKGGLRMSTLHPVLKALIAASLAAAYVVLNGAPNVVVKGLAQYAVTYPPPLAPSQVAALVLFVTASYGLMLGAAADTYLDSYLRIYHLFRRRLSAKPLITLAWLVAVSWPVCLFKTCDAASHAALISLWPLALWALKLNIFRNQDAVLLLLALLAVGLLSARPELAAAAALLPIIPWLSEEVRHVLSADR